MNKKIVFVASLLLATPANIREDILLMKKLTKKYTGGNTFEQPGQIQALAKAFGVDVMEALNWTFTSSLPSKHFQRAKELLSKD